MSAPGRPSDTYRMDREAIAAALKGETIPPPAIAEALREAAEGPGQDVTMERCEACASCASCGGLHMVTLAQNARWRHEHEKPVPELEPESGT